MLIVSILVFINICTFYSYNFNLYIKCINIIKENNKYIKLYISNLMLEKNNNLIYKYDNRKQNITFWTSTYLVVIAVIFITIGLIFPNDFTFFGIPGLGVINYIVILYLFGAIGFLYNKIN